MKQRASLLDKSAIILPAGYIKGEFCFTILLFFILFFLFNVCLRDLIMLNQSNRELANGINVY